MLQQRFHVMFGILYVLCNLVCFSHQQEAAQQLVKDGGKSVKDGAREAEKQLRDAEVIYKGRPLTEATAGKELMQNGTTKIQDGLVSLKDAKAYVESKKTVERKTIEEIKKEFKASLKRLKEIRTLEDEIHSGIEKGKTALDVHNVYVREVEREVAQNAGIEDLEKRTDQIAKGIGLVETGSLEDSMGRFQHADAQSQILKVPHQAGGNRSKFPVLGLAFRPKIVEFSIRAKKRVGRGAFDNKWADTCMNDPQRIVPWYELEQLPEENFVQSGCGRHGDQHYGITLQTIDGLCDALTLMHEGWDSVCDSPCEPQLNYGSPRPFRSLRGAMLEFNPRHIHLGLRVRSIAYRFSAFEGVWEICPWSCGFCGRWTRWFDDQISMINPGYYTVMSTNNECKHAQNVWDNIGVYTMRQLSSAMKFCDIERDWYGACRAFTMFYYRWAATPTDFRRRYSDWRCASSRRREYHQGCATPTLYGGRRRIGDSALGGESLSDIAEDNWGSITLYYQKFGAQTTNPSQAKKCFYRAGWGERTPLCFADRDRRMEFETFYAAPESADIYRNVAQFICTYLAQQIPESSPGIVGDEAICDTVHSDFSRKLWPSQIFNSPREMLSHSPVYLTCSVECGCPFKCPKKYHCIPGCSKLVTEFDYAAEDEMLHCQNHPDYDPEKLIEQDMIHAVSVEISNHINNPGRLQPTAHLDEFCCTVLNRGVSDYSELHCFNVVRERAMYNLASVLTPDADPGLPYEMIKTWLFREYADYGMTRSYITNNMDHWPNAPISQVCRRNCGCNDYVLTKYKLYIQSTDKAFVGPLYAQYKGYSGVGRSFLVYEQCRTICDMDTTCTGFELGYRGKSEPSNPKCLTFVHTEWIKSVFSIDQHSARMSNLYSEVWEPAVSAFQKTDIKRCPNTGDVQEGNLGFYNEVTFTRIISEFSYRSKEDKADSFSYSFRSFTFDTDEFCLSYAERGFCKGTFSKSNIDEVLYQLTNVTSFQNLPNVPFPKVCPITCGCPVSNNATWCKNDPEDSIDNAKLASWRDEWKYIRELSVLSVETFCVSLDIYCTGFEKFLSIAQYMNWYAVGLTCREPPKYDCEGAFQFLPDISIGNFCRRSCDACHFHAPGQNMTCGFRETKLTHFFLATDDNFLDFGKLISIQRFCANATANPGCSSETFASEWCGLHPEWSCPFICGGSDSCDELKLCKTRPCGAMVLPEIVTDDTPWLNRSAGIYYFYFGSDDYYYEDNVKQSMNFVYDMGWDTESNVCSGLMEENWWMQPYCASKISSFCDNDACNFVEKDARMQEVCLKGHDPSSTQGRENLEACRKSGVLDKDKCTYLELTMYFDQAKAKLVDEKELTAICDQKWEHNTSCNDGCWDLPGVNESVFDKWIVIRPACWEGNGLASYLTAAFFGGFSSDDKFNPRGADMPWAQAGITSTDTFMTAIAMGGGGCLSVFSQIGYFRPWSKLIRAGVVSQVVSCSGGTWAFTGFGLKEDPNAAYVVKDALGVRTPMMTTIQKLDVSQDSFVGRECTRNVYSMRIRQRTMWKRDFMKVWLVDCMGCTVAGKSLEFLTPQACSKQPEIWTQKTTIAMMGVTAPCLWSQKWTMGVVNKYQDMRLVLSQGWGLSWQNVIFHWFFKGLGLPKNASLGNTLQWLRERQKALLNFGYKADPWLHFEWLITAARYNPAVFADQASQSKIGNGNGPLASNLLKFREPYVVSSMVQKEQGTESAIWEPNMRSVLEWVALTSDARSTIILNEAFVLESGLCTAQDPSRRRKYSPDKPSVKANKNDIARVAFNMLPGFFTKMVTKKGVAAFPGLGDVIDPDLKPKYNNVPSPTGTLSALFKNAFFLAWAKDDPKTVIADAFAVDESGILLSVARIDAGRLLPTRIESAPKWKTYKLVSMITRNDFAYVSTFFEATVEAIAPFKEVYRIVGEYWDCDGKRIPNPQRAFTFKHLFPYNGLYSGDDLTPCGNSTTNSSGDSTTDSSGFREMKCAMKKDCVATMKVKVESNSYFSIIGGYDLTFSVTTLIRCTTDDAMMGIMPPSYETDIMKRHKDFPQLTTDDAEAFFHTGYLDAWALMNCAALRADLFECLTWQYERGPCADHTSGKCIEWEMCDLRDRIVNDCFVFFDRRQQTCAHRWESNINEDTDVSKGLRMYNFAHQEDDPYLVPLDPYNQRPGGLCVCIRETVTWNNNEEIRSGTINCQTIACYEQDQCSCPEGEINDCMHPEHEHLGVPMPPHCLPFVNQNPPDSCTWQCPCDSDCAQSNNPSEDDSNNEEVISGRTIDQYYDYRGDVGQVQNRHGRNQYH